MIVVLTGGTGGAKLIHGLNLVIPQEKLFVICNTADDFILHGLHISPDVDTIIYTLAGIADPGKGWGIKNDTFACLEAMGRLGAETWFKIGDRDLATHTVRTRLMHQGASLTEVTARIGRALELRATVVPMSDDRVETRLTTPHGEISFQEFFVQRGCADEIMAVRYSGAEASRPAPGIDQAIAAAALVIIAPSNPVTSIGPILAVPGVRAALQNTTARVLGVSPILAGRPVSGPADKLMAACGAEVSAFGVAAGYADFLDVIFIAADDGALARRIAALDVEARPASILLDSVAARIRLAQEVLAAADYVD